MPVDKSSDRVRQMFGQIAGRYDFLNHLLSLGIDRYWRWQTVRRVPPRGELPILDVCTGTGDLAFAYDRAAGGNVNIVGADFCHEMLEIGRKKAATAGADGRITFLEADAQSLPVPTGAFQIVSRRVRAAQRGRHRPRPRRDGPRRRARRPRRRARILVAHLCNRSRAFTVGTFATCCRGSAS